MRKDKFAVIAAIIGIIFAIGLVGCGDSGDAESKAAIADGVTDGLEQLKSGSGEAVDLAKETLNSYVGSQLEDMGISDDELISTYLQDFDYEVGDVTMTGSSATVHVTLTCRSVADIAKEFVSQSRGLNDEEAARSSCSVWRMPPRPSPRPMSTCKRERMAHGIRLGDSRAPSSSCASSA